jgi:hypothetical protein
VARLDQFLNVAPRHVRWAVELRDSSWVHDDVFAVLERHQAALCIHDLLPDHPWLLTAPWTYVRFHGPRALEQAYHGRYTGRRLRPTAERLGTWLDDGVDVWATSTTTWAAPRREMPPGSATGSRPRPRPAVTQPARAGTPEGRRARAPTRGGAMPGKSARVKNEKQYEALKDKGMSKERAAKIANSPKASSHGGKQSHKGGGSSKQGGTTAQHKAAGRKGGKATARKG